MTARLAGMKRCRGIGCETLIPHGKRRYCQLCAVRCRECHVAGGYHQGHCRWVGRRHRPPARLWNRVTVADVAEIYTTERAAALRIGMRYVPRADAEDVVQDAAVTMLRRRRWLRFASAEYLRKAVEYGALRLAVRARQTVCADERVLEWAVARATPSARWEG
jgi:hypothetical protein